MLCVLPFASCANEPGEIVVSSPQPVLRPTETATARRPGRAASRAPTRKRAEAGDGSSDRGKQFLIRSVKPQTGASRSSGVEKGAHDGGGETRTHQFRGAVYTGIFVGTLATYAPIPAVFFSFSLLLSTSGRALVMLGPGAAHGCPPLSGACHRGAHQQKKTGGDPKSHVGAPGHYCSRGARRGVFFLLLPDAGALMGRRALGVASRGGAHPKWPL